MELRSVFVGYLYGPAQCGHVEQKHICIVCLWGKLVSVSKESHLIKDRDTTKKKSMCIVFMWFEISIL